MAAPQALTSREFDLPEGLRFLDAEVWRAAQALGVDVRSGAAGAGKAHVVGKDQDNVWPAGQLNRAPLVFGPVCEGLG